MDEMNITSFSSSLSQTFFLAWRWRMLFLQCFTVFYVFLWNGLINRTSIFIAEELDVCPCWNRKILHLPWMTKDVWNMLTIWSAVSFILVVRFRSRTCDNALENHGRNEERTFFIFASMKFFWWRWKMLFSHCVLQCFMFFTWRYYTPPTPPPPFCKQQRNFQRNTIFQPSNIFQDSTSSNALHMTLLHPPHPPTPPSVNNNETFNVTPSSNQATSSRIQDHPTHFTWRYYTPPHPHPPTPHLYTRTTFMI